MLLLAVTGLTVLPAGAASAHPLGNFTVNTADRLVVTAEGVAVTHVVDLAELPTVQLAQSRNGVDTDRDGSLSDVELTAYAGRECRRVADLLLLTVDGSPSGLTVKAATGASRPGATPALSTTRIVCDLLAPERPRSQVSFSDPVATERNGWREVTAASQCGDLRDSTVPVQSRTDLLLSYPQELLSSPSDVTEAAFAVRDGAACTSSARADGGQAGADQVAARGVDRVSRSFTDFLGRTDLTLPFALVSLLAATLFGVLHALAPGHGKTVMAAYLVGQRGTRRQALQLGAIVTFTHTASVLALGALLALGTLAAPELVVPFTEILSGVLLAAVGVYLLVLAVRRRRGEADHGHDHGHDHDHDHPHDHDHGHDHPHEPARVPVSVGAGASAGAVAEPVPAGAPLTHSHGGRAHSHAPLPEGRLTWQSLAGMGVAGGLVPSPSALLVLLSATALGRAWFGVVLVVAYGAGMAVTLTLAGLLLLRARAVLDRRGWSAGRGARLARLVPLFTAGIVVLVGLGLVLRGVLTGRGLI